MVKVTWLEWIVANRWLAGLLAVIGGGVYLVQSWIYSHTQVSVLDEGLYLLKGYLFATGKYHPFQDYGPWTNHMPFSFLIPGYIQVWFGQGLRTGRFLSISLGILFLVGFWIVTRRYGGWWWAAVAIWVVALNPAVIKTYSVMSSQVLVASMLVWIFVLTLGEERKLWQIIIGAALAGLLPLTRLNMFPLLPLLLLYILWERGINRGSWAVVVGLLTFSLGHALYWPGIMRIWASWLPSNLTPFLNSWRRVNGGKGVWDPYISLELRVVSFFEGIRFHFVSFIGIITAFFVWFDLKKKKREFKEFKTFVFLSVFFVVMLVIHAWAALLKDYCVFCFSSYLSFFSYMGFLIFVIAFSNWNKDPIIFGKKWMGLLIVLISLGVGYSAHRTINDNVFMDRMMNVIFSIPIPRIKDGQIQSGTISWLGLFTNKMGWDYVDVLSKAQMIFYMIFAVFIGVAGTLILLHVFSKFGNKERFQKNIQHPGHGFMLFSFFILGIILTPTVFLGGGRNIYDCEQNVIATYENNGAYLDENIPLNSKVYWQGGLALSVLLYLPDVEFYPAQFNHIYSYREGGDPEELSKFGLWNETLLRLWASEADTILVAERSYSGWITELLESGEFVEIAPTSPLNPCRPDTRIHIYQRIQ